MPGNEIAVHGIHVGILPALVIEHPLGQKFQMGGQTHDLKAGLIQRDAVGVLDDIQRTLDEFQNVIRRAPVH